MKITYKDISIVKFNYLEYKCFTMVNGYLFERKYYGFSKKNVLKRFHEDANEQSKIIGL